MRKLLNARVIKFERFVRTSEEEKRGKEKRLYRITVYGLLIYFNIDKDSITNIHVIVKAHSNKFLMFEKWRYFKDHGLEDEILSKFFTGEPPGEKNKRRGTSPLPIVSSGIRPFYR